MGFLDHSTNNIVVDAVLTDRGRELLAGQNGNTASFKITKFSLSDDEVDYSIIKKYGRTVGKEKIIKNTPIFEAQTKSYLAQKHRMFTLANPNVAVLPSITCDDSPAFVISDQNKKQQTITVKTDLNGDRPVPQEIIDDSYYLIIPDKLLRISSNRSPIDIDESTSLLNATYVVRADSVAPNGFSSAIIKIEARPSIDSTLMSVYGDSTGTISAFITIIGASSGARKDIKFTIKYNN